MKTRRILLIVFSCALALLVTAMLPAAADRLEAIRIDGGAQGTGGIQENGNIYTFTRDINGSLVVQRDNIVIDGAGFTLSGTGAWEPKGVDLTGRSNVTVKNLAVQYFQFGFWLENSSGNVVSNCTVTWNSEWGIELRNSSMGNTVTGNILVNNHYGGIRVRDGSNGNTFSGNTITDHGRGIDLATSENNMVKGNYIGDNNDGLATSDALDTIAGNTITECFDRGVFLNGARGNIVSANNITGNGVGVLSSTGDNNTISGNNFVDNYAQALCIGAAADRWDGNYWSDYNGTGSEPYIIDASNQDSSPLADATAIPELPLWTVYAVLAVMAAAVCAAKRKLRSRGDV